MKFFLAMIMGIATIALSSHLCFSDTHMSSNERLGYKSTDKLLIVHADDLGMSHTVNRASFDAFKKGIVKSGSVMMPTPWVPEVVNWAKDNKADLGIHITLTSEWQNLKWFPLSSNPRTLIDPNGYLWPTLKLAVAHATPEHIEAEIEAQISRAFSLGLNPTHIDSHMGVHFAKPEYLKSVLKLAQEYHISPMLIRWSPEFEATCERYGIPAEEIKVLIEQAEKNGTILLDHLQTGVNGRTVLERKNSYIEYLKNLKPGLNQLIVHLGHLDEEMQGIMINAPEGEYRRYADYSMFTDPSTAQLIDSLNIKIIDWSFIQKQSK